MKIIKEGKKHLDYCSKCGCEFEYELDEIGTTIPGKVECPCCGEYLYHPNQDAKIDNIIYHPGTIVNNPVLDNTVTTYTDLKTISVLLDEGTSIHSKPNWSSDEDIEEGLYNRWGNVACRAIKKDLEILNILKKYIYINDYGFVCSKGGIMKENKIVKEWLENEK